MGQGPRQQQWGGQQFMQEGEGGIWGTCENTCPGGVSQELGWAVGRTSAALPPLPPGCYGAPQGQSDTTQPQPSPPACTEPGLQKPGINPRNSENPPGNSEADMGDPKENRAGLGEDRPPACPQHHNGEWGQAPASATPRQQRARRRLIPLPPLPAARNAREGRGSSHGTRAI